MSVKADGCPSHGSGLGLAVGGLALALAAAACTESSPSFGASVGGRTPAGTSPAEMEVSPRAPADPVAVKAVYGSFWSVLTTFDRRYPEPRWRAALGRVSTDPQLSQAIAVAKEQRRNGIALYGRPVSRTPRIVMGPAGRASVFDCVDFSRSGQADRRTGQRRTVGVARTPVRLTVMKTASGWRVATVVFPGGDC